MLEVGVNSIFGGTKTSFLSTLLDESLCIFIVLESTPILLICRLRILFSSLSVRFCSLLFLSSFLKFATMFSRYLMCSTLYSFCFWKSAFRGFGLVIGSKLSEGNYGKCFLCSCTRSGCWWHGRLLAWKYASHKPSDSLSFCRLCEKCYPSILSPNQ